MFRRYDNENDFINDIKNGWNRRVKSVKIWGIIAAVLMIIMGILCVVYPIETTYVIEVMVSAAFFVVGIWGLVRYFQLPPVLQSGVGLASSILNILLGIMLLTSPAVDMLETFGFMLGLNLLMLGFEQVARTGRLHAVGVTETGWLTVDGILNIICGVILLFSPFMSVFAVSVVFAFYLLVGGITLLIGCINMKSIDS